MRKLVAFVLPIVAVACSDSPALEISDEATSPVTEIEGEITSLTHLEELTGLYRDRERLSAENGSAYAAGWRMSLDDAKRQVDDGITFHVRALYSQLAGEEGIAYTRARLAEIIVEYASVTTEEVTGDIDRVDVPFPEEAAAER